MMNNMMMNNMMNNMNPMMINNMGINPIGLNVQPNLMLDETAKNIKTIIEPYEKKIKELEEIIRQKDFEIVVLKQKLNKQNLNISMNMNQMNPLNQMNMINMNQPNQINQINIIASNKEIINDKGKEINIKIQKDNDEILDFKFFENDLASELRKCKLGRGSYNYKYKPLIPHLTLKDNGISDNTLIKYKSSMMNVVFKTNFGVANSLVLSYDCPLGIAICYYIMKYENPLYLLTILNNRDKIIFLYNNTKLKVKDKTPIEIIFDKTPWPCINVVIEKL